MDARAADVGGTSVGSVRAEGDALPSLTDADAAFVDALRTALASDPAAASRPGQLRQKVEAALGAEDSARLRPLVHQVVAAAEENLPGYLTRIMPLTAQSLHQLSGELATARGWNDATAQRVTQVWAHALGFGGVADVWPQGAAPASMPPSPSAARPAAVPDGLTALPPASPPGEPRSTPASEPSSGPTPWPAARGRLAKRHATSSSGEPALAVVRSYAGMSLELYIGLVSVLAVLLVVVFAVFHLVVGALPMILIAFGLRRALASGVLVATAGGVEFTPYSALGSKPQSQGVFSAAWADVTVTDGSFSAFEMAGRKVQVGPFNRQFTRASLAYAGRGS